MSKDYMNYFLVIFASIIWGLAGIFAKFSDLTVFQICSLRFFFPVLCSFLYLVIYKIKIVFKPVLLSISFITFFRLLSQMYSFKMSPSLGVSLILVYMWPLFHYLVMVIYQHEIFSKYSFLCCLGSVFGVSLIFLNIDFTFSSLAFFSYLAALLSAILTGYNTFLIKIYAADLTAMETVFYYNLVGGMLFFPFLFTLGNQSMFQVSMGVCFGLVVGFVSFLLFFYSLKRVNSSNASSLTYLEIPSTLLLAFLIFNESISLLMVGGIVMIFISSYMLLSQKIGKR